MTSIPTGATNTDLVINYKALNQGDKKQIGGNDAATADTVNYADGLTDKELEALDANQDGKITYKEFKAGIVGKDGDSGAAIKSSDIAGLWNKYSQAYMKVEDVTTTGASPLNNIVTSGTNQNKSYKVRTTESGSATTTATLIQKKGAAGVTNVLKANGKISAVQNKENGINISGIIYNSSNKITQVTIGNQVYTNFISSSEHPNVLNVQDSSNNTVAVITTDGSGNITSIKTNYSSDHKKYTELTFDASGNPKELKEHSISGTGSSTNDTIVTKSATSNVSSINKTTAELAAKVDSDSIDSIDFRDVLEVLSGEKNYWNDEMFKNLSAELLAKLQTGNITNTDQFATDFVTAHSEFAGDESKIKTILKNLCGSNKTLSLEDVGRFSTAYALLSKKGEGASDNSSKQTLGNLKNLVITMEQNTKNQSAIADHAHLLNPSISVDEAMSVLAKVEASDNGKGNGTIDGVELKAAARQVLFNGSHPAGADDEYGATASMGSIDSATASKLVNDSKASFSELCDIYTKSGDTKLSESEKQDLLVALSKELYANGNNGSMTFTKMETWVNNNYSDPQKTTIKNMLKNMGCQTTGSSDHWISAQDIGRATASMAILKSANVPVSKANMDSLTPILRANSKISTIASKIQQLPNIGQLFSSTNIETVLTAADGTAGLHFTNSDKKASGNDTLNASTIIKNAQQNIGKMLDILDGNSSLNISDKVKNNFMAELNERLSKSDIKDTNAWVDSFCSAHNITDTNQIAALKSILTKMSDSGSSDGGSGTLSFKDVGRFTTAYALLQSGSSITADNLTNVAKSVNKGINTLKSTASSNGCTLNSNTIDEIVKAAETAGGAKTTNSIVSDAEAKKLGSATLGDITGTSKIKDTSAVTKLKSSNINDRKAVFTDMIKTYQSLYCTGNEKTATLPSDLFDNLAKLPSDGTDSITITKFINTYYKNASQDVQKAIRQTLNGLNEDNGNIRMMDITKSLTSFAILKSEGIELTKDNLDKAQRAINGKNTFSEVNNAFKTQFGIPTANTNTILSSLFTNWDEHYDKNFLKTT